MPPSKTSRIQLVCPSCSATFWTRVRGRSTKCPHCKAGRYVRQDAEWEGPVTAETQRDYEQAARVANRLPVWCSCSNCGEAWQSRAKDQQRVRCPSCRIGIRVPYRTHANTGTAPERYRRRPSPRPSPPPPSRPARARPAPLTANIRRPPFQPYRPCEACAEENTRTEAGTFPPAAHRLTVHENGIHRATADLCNRHAAMVHALPARNPRITVTDIR
jgi:DNA-directed RNA polymerase subunit RPC12/RpoP